MMTAQYWSHQSGRKDTEMWNKQWERVDRFLKKWKLIERGDHILLGISGGADSVCLARYFLAKRESLALNLYAVHVNHMLRGDEAKRDEEFVREFCRQWNIPLHIEYRDIKKESTGNGGNFTCKRRDYSTVFMSVQRRNHRCFKRIKAGLCG